MLLNSRSFTLKYQLPSEDIIEEYDRATSSATVTATPRILLFLFVNKLETAATLGSLLDRPNSHVDALNQSGLLPRGLSESAAVNNTLVNLDESSGTEADIQNLEINVGGDNKRGDSVANGVVSHHEMHMSSMPDFPMTEAAGGIPISVPVIAEIDLYKFHPW